MILDLVHWFLCTNLFCLIVRIREKRKRKRVGWSSHDSAQSGTPDCPVVDRIRRRRTAIIHRIVRWCTGLSGEPTTASATVGRQIRGRRVARSNSRQEAPDSVWCANGYNSATVGCAILGRRSAPDTEQCMSGGAPDC
jgi:hypothetical protein